MSRIVPEDPSKPNGETPQQPGSGTPVKDGPVVREVRKNVIPQEAFKKAVDAAAAQDKARIAAATAPRFQDTASEVFQYSITYTPQCVGKIAEVPSQLRYRPIDGLTIQMINEMNVEELDEMVNFVLDSLCFETKTEKFTHWNLPNPDKIRAYINLRINSLGEILDAVSGFCSSCAKLQPILKLNLMELEEVDMKPEYKEPFPLKTTIRDPQNVRENKLVRFTARIIRSGDLKKAKSYYDKNKEFITRYFSNVSEDKKDVVIQLMEYANSLLTYEGRDITFEEAVVICRDSAPVMEALTAFNNHFSYGLKLETKGVCLNAECPSNVSQEISTFDSPGRRSVTGERTAHFQIPVQPAFFYLPDASERIMEYLDDN